VLICYEMVTVPITPRSPVVAEIADRTALDILEGGEFEGLG